MISAVEPSFIIGDNSFGELVGNILDVENGFILPPCSKAVVVEIRADIHAGPAQRQQRIVEVKQVGIVLVDQVARPVVEVLHIGCVGQARRWVFHAIEPLRIEPLPPLIFAVRLGNTAVIWNASVRAGLCRRRATAGTTTSCAPDGLSRQIADPVFARPRPMRQ